MIKDVLKDPDSAKFEKLIITNNGVGCGYVNSRNSMGGYVGFKGVVAVPSEKVVFEQSVTIDKNQKWSQIEFLTAADVYCRDYFFVSSQYDAMRKELISTLND